MRVTVCEGAEITAHQMTNIKNEVEVLLGGPPTPARTGEKVVAVVKWIDGTVLDSVWQVAT